MAKVYYSFFFKYECPACDHEWDSYDEDEEGRAEDCPSCEYEEGAKVWPYSSDFSRDSYKGEFNKNQKQFEMKEVNVTLAEGQQILEIRQGQAAEIHELNDLTITGTLNSPAKFLLIRKEQIDPTKSHVIVNEDAGTICLVANDREQVGGIIVTGELKLHPDFTRTGVNTDLSRTTFKLAKWIKMNRPLFDSNAEAARLVTELRNFKAKVEKDVEKNEDERANHSMKISQAVDSNIPEGFVLHVPLFVGSKKSTIKIEIVIDPDDLTCSLLSPDAADLIKKEKESAIAAQVKNFNDYVVIYV